MLDLKLQRYGLLCKLCHSQQIVPCLVYHLAQFIVTVSELLSQHLLVHEATSCIVLRFVFCKLFVLFYQSLIVVIDSVHLRNVRVLCHTSFSFYHFMLLKVSEVFKWFYIVLQEPSSYL